jgi:hypothetical protein
MSQKPELLALASADDHMIKALHDES